MVKVKNINGTSGNKCGCQDWTTHWEKHSGQKKPIYCVVPNCCEMDLVGAHVQKAGAQDSSWYIAMICRSHNGHKDELDIADSHRLVPANKANTCGS